MTPSSLRLPPLALYIHIPWCIRKCPYCDFNSHAAGNALPEREYVAALIADLALDQHHLQGRKLTSIFFGGGTPSLFSAAAIGEILAAAEQQIGFEADCEITLEANPGTFEQAKFSGFRQAGINRLSIGIQSFDAHYLQVLGRVHSGDEARRAIEVANTAGFDNFNLDLMHALPNQTADQALADLTTALEYQPTHLSWYQLTIEPNTAFYSAPPPTPDEDQVAEIQQQGFELLAENGFDHYEVSAHAKPGLASRHNLNYWQFGDYLGIGAGAHGKITNVTSGTITRYQKTRAPKDYLSRTDNYTAKQQLLDAEELPVEFLLNALRLREGVDSRLFSERTGLPLKHLQPQWDNWVSKGALQRLDQRIATTEIGYRFLNTVLSDF